MSLRVFISHANQDSAFADGLASDLRRCGADVWLDATHIGPGNFVQRINDALNARDVLVLVLTPNALASRWVPDEMDAALVRYKQGFMRAPIVVLAKPVPLRDIPALWTTYNRIDATSHYDRALPTITRALGIALPEAPQPEAPKVASATSGPAGKSAADAERAAPTASSSGSPAPGIDVPQRQSTAKPSTPVKEPRQSGGGPTLSRRSLLIGAGTIAVAGGGIGAVLKLANLPGGPSTKTTRPGEQVWAFYSSGAVSTKPAVANGLVYVGAENNTTYALDANTGAKRWSFRAGDSAGSPVVAGSTVYVSSLDTNLYALDASTGTKQWSYQAGGDLLVGGPVLANGMLYVTVGLDRIYALDATTRSANWTFQTGNPTGIPIGAGNFITLANGVVYVNSRDSQVYALYANSGGKIWSFKTGNWFLSSPAVAGGLVYAISTDSYVYALDVNTGAKRWSYNFDADAAVISDPTVANGVVYFNAGSGYADSVDGKVYALDAQSGTLRWNFRMGHPIQSSPAVANGIVYVGSYDGYVYALDANTGVQQWKFEAGGEVYSSPTIFNGVVYVGTADLFGLGQGGVYAIGA